jgi:prepilin-type N-terminal cleavage/methylation domain-containing protein
VKEMIAKKRCNKGFTLIELLITVGILSIIGTVAITSYIGMTLKASRSEAYGNLEAIRMFQEQFFAENAVYTANLADVPGFNPGPNALFVYAFATGVALAPPVPVPYTGATSPQPNCFVAEATGIPGSRVAGDRFAIDCNNNKNF